MNESLWEWKLNQLWYGVLLLWHSELSLQTKQFDIDTATSLTYLAVGHHQTNKEVTDNTPTG